MSFVKYRLKEVAQDFGVAPKEIAQIVEKFTEKPKSNTQVLTDEELNCVFDYMTQKNQISDLSVIFAVAAPKAAPKAEAPKDAPKAENKPQQAPASSRAISPRHSSPLPRSLSSLRSPLSPSVSVSAVWLTPLLSR